MLAQNYDPEMFASVREQVPEGTRTVAILA